MEWINLIESNCFESQLIHYFVINKNGKHSVGLGEAIVCDDASRYIELYDCDDQSLVNEVIPTAHVVKVSQHPFTFPTVTEALTSFTKLGSKQPQNGRYIIISKHDKFDLDLDDYGNMQGEPTGACDHCLHLGYINKDPDEAWKFDFIGVAEISSLDWDEAYCITHFRKFEYSSWDNAIHKTTSEGDD